MGMTVDKSRRHNQTFGIIIQSKLRAQLVGHVADGQAKDIAGDRVG